MAVGLHPLIMNFVALVEIAGKHRLPVQGGLSTQAFPHGQLGARSQQILWKPLMGRDLQHPGIVLHQENRALVFNGQPGQGKNLLKGARQKLLYGQVLLGQLQQGIDCILIPVMPPQLLIGCPPLGNRPGRQPSQGQAEQPQN